MENEAQNQIQNEPEKKTGRFQSFINRFIRSKDDYVKEAVAASVERFENLNSLTAERKSKIFPELSKSLIIKAQADYYTVVFSDLLGNLGVFLLFLAMIATPYFLVRALQLFYESVLWLVGVYVLFIVFIYLILGLSLVFNRLGLSLYPILSSFVLILLPILIWIYSIKASYQLYSLPNWLISLFLAGLASAIIFLLIAVILVVLVFLLLQVINFATSYKIRFKPEIELINELLKFISKIERRADDWNDFEFKQEICKSLETIAARLQQVGRRVRTGDSETDVWYKRQVAGAAQAFRSKKKIILNSTPISRQQLMNSVSLSFIRILQGDWGNLETENQEVLRQESKYWLRRIIETAKSLIVSAIPLILVYTLQSTPLRLEEPYLSYAKIGGIAWFTISFIIMLDPLYNSKLTALKDIKGLLPLGGKDK